MNAFVKNTPRPHIVTFKYGELFCGPGGLALGAKISKVMKDDIVYRLDHVWAADYDTDSCDTYKHNICPDNPKIIICSDAKKLTRRTLPAIHGFGFGFPCNDFSLVGEQKGTNGSYGGLYKIGVQILKKYKPKFFLAENVSGIRSSNDGKAFEKILEELWSAGYRLYPHLYKFEEYGIPQNRHRVIIVGIRRDLPYVFNPPAPTGVKVSAREAIENPPILSGALNHELTKQSKNVIERLKHIEQGQNAFNSKLPKHLSLNVKGARLSQIYRRLIANKPAYTITGSGGGGTHVYHWEEPRALTNRERARLQTFPDDYCFYGSKESVRRQIGMAVPPQGAKEIFTAILKTFASVKYPHVTPNITLHAKITDQLGILRDAD
jgi:DNA (cytosine-5)-methyltransferase 1